MIAYQLSDSSCRDQAEPPGPGIPTFIPTTPPYGVDRTELVENRCRSADWERRSRRPNTIYTTFEGTSEIRRPASPARSWVCTSQSRRARGGCPSVADLQGGVPRLGLTFSAHLRRSSEASLLGTPDNQQVGAAWVGALSRSSALRTVTVTVFVREHLIRYERFDVTVSSHTTDQVVTSGFGVSLRGERPQILDPVAVVD